MEWLKNDILSNWCSENINETQVILPETKCKFKVHSLIWNFEFSLVLTCDIIFYGEVTPVSVVPDQLIDLLSWLVGYFKVIHAHYSVTFLYYSTSVIICVLYNLNNFFIYVYVI